LHDLFGAAATAARSFINSLIQIALSGLQPFAYGLCRA
jgi:hypothetical protein